MSASDATDRHRCGARSRGVFLAGLLAVACLPACNNSPGQPSATGGKGRPVPVTAAAVVKKAVPLELNTFGTVQALTTVAIKAQVGEVLTKVHFEKGQKVARGDLLFTLETKPYEVAAVKARAALARLKDKIIAQAEYDKAVADAEALTETVRADAAALENAQLDLVHCQIRSPIAGRAGNLLTYEGNLIKANDVPLVVINQITPIDVFFSVPQAELAQVRRYQAAGGLAVEVVLPEEPDRPERGRLTFIDNAVDVNTGAITLGATFENAAERLWPGQYVHVKLILAVPDAVVAPVAAVQTGQNEQYVFVIKPDLTVEKRLVTVSQTVGEDALIADGLRAGEQVVTDGQLSLVQGAKVELKRSRPTEVR